MKKVNIMNKTIWSLPEPRMRTNCNQIRLFILDLLNFEEKTFNLIEILITSFFFFFLYIYTTLISCKWSFSFLEIRWSTCEGKYCKSSVTFNFSNVFVASAEKGQRAEWASELFYCEFLALYFPKKFPTTRGHRTSHSHIPFESQCGKAEKMQWQLNKIKCAKNTDIICTFAGNSNSWNCWTAEICRRHFFLS